MKEINVFAYSRMKLMNDKPSKVVSWITILSILLILTLVISIFYKYNIYDNYVGYVNLGSDYRLRVIVDNNYQVKKSYLLYVDNRKYEYKIVDIIHEENYKSILIDCNLKSYLLVQNNVVPVRFLKRRTTLMKEFIKRMKKGLNL